MEVGTSVLLEICVCMSLFLARNGPTGLLWRCPLIGGDRKWLADGQNDAIDPERS
jgi:hypothetical protein